MMLDGVKRTIFDVDIWRDVERFLPDDEVIRSVVFDDLIWFVNRPKKYKNAHQKADNYIRHLKLKSNEKFGRFIGHVDVFRSIDIEKIESHLMSVY